MKSTIIKKVTEPFVRLFWKTQFRVLRACPPLCGVVTANSLGATNAPGLLAKTYLQLAIRVPGAFICHWRDKWNHRVALSRVIVIVTTRCTLNCDKCGAHIPDLKCQRDMPPSELIPDIKSLLGCVDYIHNLTLSGGEPLLHPNLDEIIRACFVQDKVGDIIVQTNGTVMPDEHVLEALRETKARVQISRYPAALQPNVGKVKNVLNENGIYYTHLSSTFWNDTKLGQPQEGSMRRRFDVCALQNCFPLMDGKLYRCSESAISLGEGLLPDCREEYIDIRTTDPAPFCTQWRQLLKKKYVSTCAYCLGRTYKSPRVPIAVQRESRKEGSGQI